MGYVAGKAMVRVMAPILNALLRSASEIMRQRFRYLYNANRAENDPRMAIKNVEFHRNANPDNIFDVENYRGTQDVTIETNISAEPYLNLKPRLPTLFWSFSASSGQHNHAQASFIRINVNQEAHRSID